MLLAGDEFGRTQQGNNNAYCQDNEISWVNWKTATKGRSLINFVQQLTKIRYRIPYPSPQPFSHRGLQRGLGDQGRDLDPPFGRGDAGGTLENRSMLRYVDRRPCQPTGLRRRGSDATLLIVLNSFHEPVPFAIPETVGSEHWSLLLDTNDASAIQAKSFKSGDKYEAAGRSLQLFVLAPDAQI